MNADVYGYIIGGLVLLVGGWLTTRANIRSNRITEGARSAIEQVKVDGEAYDRAQRINKEITDALQAEISRLHRQLGELRDQLTHATQRSVGLEAQVSQLQQTVDRMSALLARNNIPLPQDA